MKISIDNANRDFKNIPEKYPCVIYFGKIDVDCIRNDHLKWIYSGEQDYE